MDTTHHASAHVFRDLFPGPLGVAVLPIADVGVSLLAEEEHAVAGAVAKRRLEFAIGRQCARLAMRQIGIPPLAVPCGPDRAPVWPSGIVGSITHSAELAAAAVAPRQDFRSIGIDFEPVGAVARELSDVILTREEVEEYNTLSRDNDRDRLTVLFCIKEAAYKACYPIYKTFIDFQQMHVRLQPDNHAFVARADIGSLPIYGRFAVWRGTVHATAWTLDER